MLRNACAYFALSSAQMFNYHDDITLDNILIILVRKRDNHSQQVGKQWESSLFIGQPVSQSQPKYNTSVLKQSITFVGSDYNFAFKKFSLIFR